MRAHSLCKPRLGLHLIVIARESHLGDSCQAGLGPVAQRAIKKQSKIVEALGNVEPIFGPFTNAKSTPAAADRARCVGGSGQSFRGAGYEEGMV